MSRKEPLRGQKRQTGTVGLGQGGGRGVRTGERPAGGVLLFGDKSTKNAFVGDGDAVGLASGGVLETHSAPLV